MTLKEAREIMTASAKAGRPIQYRTGSGNWITLKEDRSVSFEDDNDRYRVAPQEPPKPREWWVNTYGHDLPLPVENCEFSAAELKRLGYVLTRQVL